jgi:hypothetical protein
MKTDAEYLKDNGWRLVTKSRYKYGTIHYWDHDMHQRRDGRWWTQGDAVAYQRRLDKLSRGSL